MVLVATVTHHSAPYICSVMRLKGRLQQLPECGNVSMIWLSIACIPFLVLVLVQIWFWISFAITARHFLLPCCYAMISEQTGDFSRRPPGCRHHHLHHVRWPYSMYIWLIVHRRQQQRRSSDLEYLTTPSICCMCIESNEWYMT